MRRLVVGPAWIGDMVIAQTLFQLLKHKDPTSQLDVLAPAWTKPLLDRMPEVDQALELPFRHKELELRRRYQLAKSLRTHAYNQAIVLPNSFKSALIPYWSHIPRRTGWVGEMRYPLLNDIRYLDKSRLPLMAQQFMALGLEKEELLSENLLRPALLFSETGVQDTLQHFNITPSGMPILALCPGAEFGPAKQWPAEYFAEVANAKLGAGWEVWLFGSQKDRQIAHHIEILTDHRVCNFAGRTTLSQAIDLLSLSALVVTNDSGLMHIAAALSRPLIALYGSTSPKFTPPLISPDRVKILQLSLPCSPCFKRECPLTHLKCLRDLKPNMVISNIDGFALQGRKSNG